MPTVYSSAADAPLDSKSTRRKARDIGNCLKVLKPFHESVAISCQSQYRFLPSQQVDSCRLDKVPAVLLDETGRKLTFRIYLLVVSRSLLHETSCSAMALVRREFICRSHPAPYDATDPSPARHVHSTLDVFEGVQGRSSRTFPQAQAVWPAVLIMFKARRCSAKITVHDESISTVLFSQYAPSSRETAFLGHPWCTKCTMLIVEAIFEPFLESYVGASDSGG